jgi:hypothetical protein
MSSAEQHAEHERNAARSSRTESSYAFAAGDIRGEQQGRYGWQPALPLPSEPFCHALNEVSPRPREPTPQKAEGKRGLAAKEV